MRRLWRAGPRVIAQGGRCRSAPNPLIRPERCLAVCISDAHTPAAPADSGNSGRPAPLAGSAQFILWRRRIGMTAAQYLPLPRGPRQQGAGRQLMYG